MTTAIIYNTIYYLFIDTFNILNNVNFISSSLCLKTANSDIYITVIN